MDIALEDKAADPTYHPVNRTTIDEVHRAFAEFKEINDRRLDELERRGSPDVLTEERLVRIEAALDRHHHRLDSLALKAARPALAPSQRSDPREADTEHKAAFNAYVRKGDVTAMHSLERKALSVGSEADGGYIVPEAGERQIMQALRDESPIRAISGSITISTSVLKRPFATSDAAGGWVGETEARPQTATPALAELTYPTMELYAMPAATLRLLDDAAVDVEGWLAAEVRATFAAQEGRAFVTGDGVNQPKGFLSYVTVSESAWAWGKIGHVATGANGAFAATGPADALLDLVFSLRANYRRQARFVMNRMTQAAVRRLKDEDGNYLWQPTLGAQLEPTLLGHPVAECDDMPDMAAGSLSIAFGDFSRGYLVVDRAGIHVLRDPFSAKPYVLFYTTKRVGGGVQDFNAIKLLRLSALRHI
jgi:HK97 family phage major capsid protein